MCSTVSEVRRASLVIVEYSAGIGTPQARWREIHHSLRLCMNDDNRNIPTSTLNGRYLILESF
jgi:hypothetical protein